MTPTSAYPLEPSAPRGTQLEEASGWRDPLLGGSWTQEGIHTAVGVENGKLCGKEALSPALEG